jgi:hypothetical protein
MIAGVENSIRAALGPLYGNLGTPTATAPLGDAGANATGILNGAALGTTATKVVAGGQNQGKTRRCKIVCITASRNLAYTIAPAGTTGIAIKADADGSIDEGSLIMGGGGATEWVSIPDNFDLWLVASAASTAYQITCVEV